MAEKDLVERIKEANFDEETLTKVHEALDQLVLESKPVPSDNNNVPKKEEDKGKDTIVLQDFDLGASISYDPQRDTMGFENIEEKEEKKEGKTEEKEPELTPEQKAKQEHIAKKMAIFRDCLNFETKVFGLITDLDKLNETAKFIVETILFEDPSKAEERIEYLVTVELSGAKLEKYFKGKEVEGKIVKLLDHIDEKIKEMGRYNTIKKVCDQLATLQVSQVVSVCTDALKDLCPGKDYAALYDEMILMIASTVEGHKPWLEIVKEYVFQHQNRDQVITQTFLYVKKIADSTNEMITKGQIVKGEERPKEEENKKEETAPAPLIDPSRMWVKPVLMALFVLPAPDIKKLSKQFIKKFAKEN